MTPPQAEPPRPHSRGRPSREDAALLHKRIRDTALAEFLRNGYAGSTIDGVARASGVSRTTIYALYGDKAALFTDMLRQTVRGPNLEKCIAFDDRPPAIVLGEALRRLNAAYHRDRSMQVFRLCIGEVDRFPELIEGLRDVLNSSLSGLTAYLRRLRDQGRLLIDDCDAAARLFNLLALGTIKSLMMQPDRLSAYDREGHMELALDIFMRGVLRDVPIPDGTAASTGDET